MGYEMQEKEKRKIYIDGKDRKAKVLREEEEEEMERRQRRETDE